MWVDGRTRDDVAVGHDFTRDALCRLIDFIHGQVRTAGDVQQQALGRGQVDIVEQRVGNRQLSRVNRTVFTFSLTCAHHGLAHNGHQRANVCEIEVDVARTHDQVGNGPNAVVKDFIRHLQRVGVRGTLVRHAEEVFVWNDDQGINRSGEKLNAFISLTLAHNTFKCERLGRNANSQNTAFFQCLGNERRSARTRATAHAGGDENHVDLADFVEDVLQRFFSGCPANHGVGTSAQALSRHGAQTHAAVAQGQLQRLGISVRYGKFYTL